MGPACNACGAYWHPEGYIRDSLGGFLCADCVDEDESQSDYGSSDSELCSESETDNAFAEAQADSASMSEPVAGLYAAFGYGPAVSTGPGSVGGTLSPQASFGVTSLPPAGPAGAEVPSPPYT